MAEINLYIRGAKALNIDSETVKKVLKSACANVLTSENVTFNTEVTVSFVSEEEMRGFNKIFRGEDKITDVLSFPAEEINPENGFAILGDVIICPVKMYEQAIAYGNGVIRELAFLTVHSLLHLLGCDHENSEEEEEMCLKQAAVLEKMGLGLK
jgi:probable rRNA maturation factor